MAVNHTIQADVIDINADRPNVNDAFLLDTNVWYWITYTRASQSYSPPLQYQTHYPRYTNEALKVGAKILQSGLSLAELAHQIERVEREIYEKSETKITPKEYRHNLPKERNRVVSEINAAWAQIKNLATPLEVTINPLTVDASLVRMQTAKVDGYDLFMLESMITNGITQIITDDGDFATVAGIQVFTANRNVIKAAKSQRRLVRR